MRLAFVRREVVHCQRLPDPDLLELHLLGHFLGFSFLRVIAELFEDLHFCLLPGLLEAPFLVCESNLRPHIFHLPKHLKVSFLRDVPVSDWVTLPEKVSLKRLRHFLAFSYEFV